MGTSEERRKRALIEQLKKQAHDALCNFSKRNLWKPIEGAPLTGEPVWAKGRVSYGDQYSTFVGWAFWDGFHWVSAGDQRLLILDKFMERV